jgi:hypothetical protein
MASIARTGYKQPYGGYDGDRFEREWKAEQRTRTDLTSAVERLASGMPLRQPSRLRRRWRWLVGWRKRRKAEREAWEELAEIEDELPNGNCICVRRVQFFASVSDLGIDPDPHPFALLSCLLKLGQLHRPVRTGHLVVS